MLNQELLSKLRQMKMTGLAEVLEHQDQNQGYEELGFHERLNLFWTKNTVNVSIVI